MTAVFNAEWAGRALGGNGEGANDRKHQSTLKREESRSGFFIALCGAPTGIAKYEIAKDDLPRIPADQQGVTRFQPWLYDGPSIEVAKYDGSLQCEMGRPVSLDEMEKELRAANIAVEGKAKKADGIQHPRMCGASTGTMNVYRIQRSDFEKARALGFVLYVEGISIARDRRGSNVAIGP